MMNGIHDAAAAAADQKRKLEAEMLLLAETALRQMRGLAEAEPPDPEKVETLAKGLDSLLKNKDFPMIGRDTVRETAKEIQRNAFQRSVETVLDAAVECSRQSDDKGRNECLTRAKQHLGMALRYGADEAFREAVQKRLEVVLLTTAQGIDKRTKDAAARRTAVLDKPRRGPGGIERRRSIRYCDPPLTAVVDGLRCLTANWSTRGLLLEDYRGDLRPGDRTRLELSCSEVPGVGGRCIARVVRRTKDNGLSLEFPEINTVVLDLMHGMKGHGISPQPER
ncbi:MAG: hypothetical protein GC191_02990 [Azospirillum sp.]|nr:hypothetical protein [Azospirillum sp.]